MSLKKDGSEKLNLMQAAGADDPLLQLESLPLYVHFDFKTQKHNNLLYQGLKDELF